MKKLIALLLAVVMMLSLVACGQTSGSGAQKEQDFTVPEDSVCAVWVQINPEFELYINESGNITAMNCLNKDAEKAFKGIDVTGADFERGFRLLLDAVYENGFVSGGEVQITWGVSRLTDAVFDDAVIVDGFARATESFSNENNLGLSASMKAMDTDRPEAEEEESQNEPTPPPIEEENPFGPDVEILERDADGHITKTREVDSAGSEVLTTYGTEGRIVAVTTTSADGSVMEMKRTYRSDGTMKTEEINDYAHNIHELWTYSEDGRSRTADAGTYTKTETFHENGLLASYACQAKPGYDLGDRTYEKYTYDEKGQTLTHHIIRTNGAHIKSTYHSENAFTMVVEVNGVVDHTEYWVGNDHIGGIDSNGNPYGITHGEYSGSGSGGTVGVG